MADAQENSPDSSSDVDVADVDDENSSMLLFVNRFLPAVERDSIIGESKDSEEELLQALSNLDDEVNGFDEVSVKTVGRVIKLINSRIVLKYYFSSDLRLSIVRAMLKLYHAKDKVSIVFRIKSLNVLMAMLSKRWEKLDLTLDWQIFWDELHSIVMREKRFEVVGAESVMVEHIEKLASFLSKARPYYDCLENGNYPDPRGNVYVKAESFLQDLRMPSCIEGPLLLMSCLPTDWAHYDEVLPKWFELWSSINQNHIWDLCWSVIMARAVKHSKSFDWKPYVPFLLQKIKELLHLPSAENRRDANYSSFPRTFPSYYYFVFNKKETHQDALTKLTKIVVKIMMKDPSSSPAETSVVSMPLVIEEALEKQNLHIIGYNTKGDQINDTAKSIVEVLHMLRGFVHATNTGNYVPWICTFFSLILRTCGRLLGEALADRLADQPESVWVTGRHSALFVSGYILSLALDGVYNKSLRVSRHFASCLRHIIALQPQVMHVVCTFFLEALQPSASHQPHQTSVAFMSLSVCSRLFFFPQPLMLNYVPDILRLSLSFLEASDSSKTVMVLDLLSNIFGWMPLSKTNKVKIPHFTSYLQLLQHKEHDAHPFASNSSVYQAQYEEIVSYVSSDWTFQMLEKIFILIDSEEVKVKGAKESATSGSIVFFLAMFFQSWEDLDVSVESTVEQMIVQYILTRAPAHTDKTCGKIVEYFVGIRPQRLNALFTTFMTSDFRSASMSADKLAFRLRVIGALFRQAQGEKLSPENEQLLSALMVNPALTLHEDAKVRKHVGKVYKDVLKGGLSVYPVRVYARFAHNETLGAPNVANENDVQWFLPTPESMEMGVSVLQTLTSHCLTQIHTALDTALAVKSTAAGEKDKDTATEEKNANNTNVSTQLKRHEEAIGSALSLLRRLVRGSAEILTDEYTPETWRKVNLATGRQAYLSYLPETHSSYVKNYRTMLLSALATIHEKLEKTATSTVFSGLRNNEFIAKQWMKVFHLIVTRRVCFCKDVDKYRKGLEMQVNTHRVPLCTAVHDRLKELRALPAVLSADNNNNNLSDAKNSLVETLRSGYYWKRHDWNSNSLIAYIWVQHCVRAVTFAQASNRVLFREENETDPVFTCLRYLLDLTRHSYDEIRPQARKIFEKMTKMLGPKLNATIASLLNVFRAVPIATYYEAASTLVTLKQATMMRRIQSDVTLKIMFLESLPYVQRIANNIEEMDKKEKLMLALADCFVKYTTGWSVTPQDLHTLHARLMAPLLDTPTATGETQQTVGVSAGVSAGSSSSSSGSGTGGLRMDTFAAYTLLHLLSSQVLSPANTANMKPLVQFIQRQWTSAHGQPTQMIANTMLTRLVEIVAQEAATTTTTTSQSLVGRDWFDYWQQCWNPMNAVDGQWPSALKGLLRIVALYSTMSEEGKALWSRGVDEVLANSAFLAIVKPRSFCKRRTDQNNYSKFFGYGFAGTLWTMMTMNLIPLFPPSSSSSSSSSSASASPSQVMAKILNEHLVDLASQSGDNEKRAVNIIRAEMFGAMLRFYVSHRAGFDTVGDTVTTGALLAKYFKEQTETCSSEFLRDWQEALYFAFENVSRDDLDFVLQSELVQQILNNFRNSLNTSSETNSNNNTEDNNINNNNNNNNTEASDEGFSKLDKTIMLLNATLLSLSVAELLSLSSSSSSSSSSTTPMVLRMAKCVEDILVSPETSIVLPYRTSRAELCMTIGLLLEMTSGACQLDAVFAKILSAATSTSVSTSFSTSSSSAMNTAANTVMDVDGDTPVVAASATVSRDTDTDTTLLFRQNAVDCVSLLIARLWQRCHLRHSLPVIATLLPALFCGVAETKIDTVKSATDSLVAVFFALRPAFACDTARSYEALLQQLKVHATGSNNNSCVASNSSGISSGNWRVREAAIRSAILLLTNSWLVLSATQRQTVKDILVEGMKDAQTDVQKMAKQGMVAYLAWKTDGELQKIAEVYTRNSETLAAREKQKRRQQKSAAAAAASASTCVETPTTVATTATAGDTVSNSSRQADAAYLNTVQMMSCVILSRPYDLPKYLPALLQSFLRHTYYDTTKSTLLATVQLFQRTHQDRWEEFQKKFTSEQLEDLQGAGAAHYFA